VHYKGIVLVYAIIAGKTVCICGLAEVTYKPAKNLGLQIIRKLQKIANPQVAKFAVGPKT
jgi:hypothetical protein